MAVKNLIPTTDVKVVDIRDTLNYYGGMVTNDTTTFFTADAHIDMWSKFKPVVSTTLFYSLELWQSGGYTGDDGQCGLTIPVTTNTSMSVFREVLESEEALWTYTPPKGGTSEPRRLGDFRLYNPEAVNPVGAITTNGIAEGGTSTVEGTVTFNMDALSGLENNLTYSDIKIGGSNGTPLTQFYLGVYAYNGSTYRYATNTEPIGENYSFTVELNMTAGTWYYVPFLSSVPQVGNGNEAQGTYLSANKTAQRVTIIGSGEQVIVTIHSMWNATRTAVTDIHVGITNNTNSSVTVSNILATLRRAKGTTDEGRGSSYYNGDSAATITVPANSSVITDLGLFADIKENEYDSSYEYYIQGSAYVGDDLYTTENGIEEYMPTSVASLLSL